MYKNMTEILVEQKVASLWKNSTGCKCSRCHDDIMTYSLNRLPVHYVSTSKGELFNKASALSIEYDVEITKVVTMAMNLVEKNPRHSLNMVSTGSYMVFKEKS